MVEIYDNNTKIQSLYIMTVCPAKIEVKSSRQIPLQHQSTYLGDPESVSIEIPLLPFIPHLIKFSEIVIYEVKLVSLCSHSEVLLLSKVCFKKTVTHLLLYTIANV